MDNNFCVYEHLRKDNNDVFYIGKGKAKRVKEKSRNSHHDAVANKYGMIVRIVKDNLSEEEAFELETKLIRHYVFDLNYSIDITGYRNRSRKHILCNQTFGGEGPSGIVHSKEWRAKHSKDMSGKKNPMYGVNVWDMYDETKKKEIKQKISETSKGTNNPMHGVSPKERMDKDTYKKWHKKTSERCKSQIGSNNPNYKNDTLHKKLEANPELRMQYYPRKGLQNGRCQKVELYKLDGTLIKQFGYIGECAKYLIDNGYSKATIDSIRTNITASIRKEQSYLGFMFKFV